MYISFILCYCNFMSPELSSRRDYMRDAGFALVNDVFHQFFDDAYHTIEVKQRSSTVVIQEDLNYSAGGLMVVAEHLIVGLKGLDAPDDSSAGYGITEDDLSRDQNKFSFFGGFRNIDFTWHFAPAVANAVMQTFMSAGYISEEQYDNMTFGDWADIIGSAWFGDLMHDMALTSNGVYRGFGVLREHYLKDSLRSYLDYEPGDGMPAGDAALFEIRSVYDEEPDRTYITANTTDDFRTYLRQKMQSNNSPGCPAARKAGALSLGVVNHYKHARNLIARGDIIVLDTNLDRGSARFVQDYTPIDRALDAFAGLLDRYDEQYGTPYWHAESLQLVHESRPKTNVLIHLGHIPFDQVSQS